MITTQVLKHLPGAREDERGRSKGDFSRRATARMQLGKVGMSGLLREEGQRRRPNRILLPCGDQNYLLRPREGGGS